MRTINGVFIMMLCPFSPLLKRLNLFKQSNDSGSKPDDLRSVMCFYYFKRLLEHIVQALAPDLCCVRADAAYHASYVCSHMFKPLIE